MSIYSAATRGSSLNIRNRTVDLAVTREELTAFSERRGSIWPGVVAVYVLISATLAAFKLVDVPPVGAAQYGAAVIVFLIIGWSQYTLVQALHEAVHQTGGKRPLGRALVMIALAYAVGLTRQFGDQHSAHHKYFGDPVQDPDYSGFAVVPGSKFAMLGWLLMNLSGVSAIKDFLRKSVESGTENSVKFMGDLLRLGLVQSMIFVMFSVIFHPVYYFVFWILPVATLGKLFTAIRLLCEHGSRRHPFVLRSFAGNALQRNLFGSFGLARHAEHHLWPSIPMQSLPLAATHLRAAISDDLSHAEIPCEIHPGGHFGVLLAWFRDLPWRSRGQADARLP